MENIIERLDGVDKSREEIHNQKKEFDSMWEDVFKANLSKEQLRIFNSNKYSKEDYYGHGK